MGRHRPPPEADRTSYCGRGRGVRQGVRHGETQTAARGRPYVILRERQGCEAGVRHGETQTAARGRPYVILRERQE